MAAVELARQQLLIGGNWTDAGSGASYEQRFPYDGTAVGTAAAAGRADVRAAVDAAQAYGLVGDVIPSDVPGKLAMGVRAPAGVVVAIAPVERSRDPRHPIGCGPPRVREHGRAEGVGDLSANAGRGGSRARGRRPAAWRHQPRHERRRTRPTWSTS